MKDNKTNKLHNNTERKINNEKNKEFLKWLSSSLKKTVDNYK